jgi:hypothetical protein
VALRHRAEADLLAPAPEPPQQLRPPHQSRPAHAL